MNAMTKKLVGCVGLVMSLSLASQAGQYWWAGDGVNLGGSGTWDTSANRWRNGSASGSFTAWPNGGGDEAVFTNAVGGAAGTVTLSGTINANALSFKTNAWTLSGGTLNLGSGASTITMANVPANSHQTINSSLSGSGTLTVSGKASYGYGLYLTANNSAFTGKVVVDKASDYLGLAVTNDNALGSVPATSTADAITLKNGAFFVNNGAGTVTVAANRGLFLQHDNSMFFNPNSSATTVLNSPISGEKKFLFRRGTFYINSTNNTYKGQLHFYAEYDSVTAKTGAQNVFSHGVGVESLFLSHWGGSVLLDLNGYSQTVPSLNFYTGFNESSTKRVIDNQAVGTTAELAVGDNNAADVIFDGCIRSTQGTLAFTKIGTGNQTLRGFNTYSGATTVRSGSLTADLSASAGDGAIRTNVLPSASALVLGGGTLAVKGAATGASLQRMGNLFVNSGAGTLRITPNGGAGTTLALSNDWARSVGGTLLADLSATGSTLASSPTLTNGVIGGYAFVKDGTGTGFATFSGGNVVRYTSATTLDATVAAANLDGTVNYTVPANVQLTGSAATQTVNTVQIGNADPLRVSDGQTFVVGAGGILFLNTSWATIGYFGSGRVTSSMGDLVVNTSGGEAGFFINLVDNGAQKVGLTKTGESILYLSSAQAYSGDTVINQGQLKRSVYLPYGVGKGNVLVNWNGTMELADTANATPIRINGLSQATNNPGGLVQNWYNGPRTLMVGYGDANGSFAGTIRDNDTNTLALIKVGNGTQVLSGMNTYKGGTILSNGVLSVSSLSNIGGANANVTFAGGKLQITGTNFNSFGATPLTFTGAGGGLEIAAAGNTVTLTNNLGLGSVLTKTGSGTLLLTGTQAGTINTDDPSKISFGSGLGFYNLGVTTNGVLSPAGSGMPGTFAVTNNLTLAGKLLVDVTASTWDKVTAGGVITLSPGATLQIVDPSLLDRSKQYTLMTAGGGSVSGSLTALNLPARWKVGIFGNTVVLYYVNPGTMVSFF